MHIRGVFKNLPNIYYGGFLLKYVTTKRLSYTKELIVQKKVFNIYQLNILKNFIFMHKVKTETAPPAFLISTKLKKRAHPHSTNFSKLNYIKPRGSVLWN